MVSDCLWCFLFEDLDISGAFVRLGPAWREMLAGRGYPVPVARLLGELTATTLLLGGRLKQAGRLTVQLRGSGPISLLVIDCDEQLQIRGMARFRMPLAGDSAPELLGDGQLVLSLDMPSMREPYQSIVPLAGTSIAAIFDHYLGQSDQVPSRFLLVTTPDACAGLLVQRMPGADARDVDGWPRIEALAATVRAAELLSLPVDQLLLRLFPEEAVRLFAARTVAYNCPEDWQKIRSMLRALGAAEVYAAVHEQGEVVVRDEICNREYRFDAAAVDALFGKDSPSEPPTIH